MAATTALRRVRDVIELGFSVGVRIIDAVIQHPATSTAGVNAKTRHQADTVDDAMLVATPLPSRHLDARAKLFVEFTP